MENSKTKLSKEKVKMKMAGIVSIVRNSWSALLLTIWAVGTSWTSGLVPFTHRAA
ncbi:hypothetical protein MMMDOFMJ_1979 [Methylobacterium gnaphalii]|nr:hypothetical protein MMMDOFMJ_1979 [Methylobacterium gnaphalii]